MNKINIGVTTSVHNGYLLWLFIRLGVWLAGGKAKRITTKSFSSFKKCDGFLIAGGADINPECYGEKNSHSIYIDPSRDELEHNVISYALEIGKPVFGICRGAQMINVVSGGTIYQDAREIFKEFLPTTSIIAKMIKRRVVNITKNSKVSNIFGDGEIKVNSIHHQAINKLGKNLKITAKDSNGIVQAIESTTLQPIIGVQWHPELMLYSRRQRDFFKKLVNASKSN